MRNNPAQKSFTAGHYNHLTAGNPFSRSIVTAFLLSSLPAETVFDVTAQDNLRANAQNTRDALFEAVTGKRLSAHRLRPAKRATNDNILDEMRAQNTYRGWDGGTPPCAAM